MTSFSEAEHALMEDTARRIVRHRLAVPSMMLLETLAPMNMITASMLHVVSPMWRLALPRSRIDEIARLLEQRDALPEFLRVIDAQEERRRTEARAERVRRREGGRGPAS